jgi:competence protein ComEA
LPLASGAPAGDESDAISKEARAILRAIRGAPAVGRQATDSSSTADHGRTPDEPLPAAENGRFPAASAWATLPGEPNLPDNPPSPRGDESTTGALPRVSGARADHGRSHAAPGERSYPGPTVRDAATYLGDPMDYDEPFLSVTPAGNTTGAVRRPLPPPAWVLPDAGQGGGSAADRMAGLGLPDRPDSGPGFGEDLGWASAVPPGTAPSSPEESDEDHEEAALTSAGAFGGGRARPGGAERRVGLRAFDPGRRGARALAVVAVVVIVLAALLAWRARPRVDSVAPPSFDVAGSTTGSNAGKAGQRADVPVGAPDGTGQLAPEGVGAGSAAAQAAGSGAAGTQVVIAVGGKVRKPGLVRLPPGARVADALTAAGGAEPGVDVAMLNLARKVVDGELILVGVTPPPGVAVATGPAAGGGSPAGGPVNLNTATLADLDGLPGVGPVLAQRIIDARTAQGGFTSVGDLRKVDGIGDARYDQLKDLVTV